MTDTQPAAHPFDQPLDPPLVMRAGESLSIASDLTNVHVYGADHKLRKVYVLDDDEVYRPVDPSERPPQRLHTLREVMVKAGIDPASAEAYGLRRAGSPAS